MKCTRGLKKMANISPEAVLASCSRADSVLGISSPPLLFAVAACAKRSNDDVDVRTVSDPLSVSGFTSTNGGVDETGFCLFCKTEDEEGFAAGAAATTGTGADEGTTAGALAPCCCFAFNLSANLPFGL